MPREPLQPEHEESGEVFGRYVWSPSVQVPDSTRCPNGQLVVEKNGRGINLEYCAKGRPPLNINNKALVHFAWMLGL